MTDGACHVKYAGAGGTHMIMTPLYCWTDLVWLAALDGVSHVTGEWASSCEQVLLIVQQCHVDTRTACHEQREVIIIINIVDLGTLSVAIT